MSVAVINFLFQGEDILLTVTVALLHADHGFLVAGTAIDVGEDVRGGVVSNKVIIAHAEAVLVFHGGGKDVGGGVVSGKASLAHVGAIVADQSINVSAQILMCWYFLDSGETGPEE